MHLKQRVRYAIGGTERSVSPLEKKEEKTKYAPQAHAVYRAWGEHPYTAIPTKLTACAAITRVKRAKRPLT